MRRVLVSLFVLLSVVLVGCEGGGFSGGGDGVIRIGMITMLTGEGASLGAPIRNTTLDYFEQYPEWGGKKVEFILEDSNTNVRVGATVAQKLVDVDHVDFLISADSSGVSLAVVPIAEKAGVPVISTTSTSPELSGISKYFFRTAPSDSLGGEVMAKTVTSMEFLRVAVFVENTDFATAYADQFVKNYGGEIVIQESYNSDVTDFKTLLAKAKESGAQTVVQFNQSPVAAGILAKQNRELGLDFQIFSTDATSGDDFFDIAKDSAEGQIIIMTRPDEERSDVVEFLEAYRVKHGESTLDAYLTLQWDTLEIVRRSIEAVGTDGEVLVEYLRSMPGYSGLAGEIEFDENGDSSIEPSVLIAKDGKFVLRR